ncbi:MAG: YraN family protein [Selenomonadaceae bacterium]|nr:YraN family protein [Selenomonadaceae bacterium]
MTARTKNLGNAGETFAANFLEQKGYKIITKNFRVRSAEIDIVAEFEGTIIFVEVKTRSDVKHGLPIEAVNFRKQQKIIEAASVFLQDEKYCDCACRFDVVEVYSNGVKFSARHIENAFEVTSEF